jgi:hypothetical protein
MLTNVDCPLDQANQKHCGNPAGIGVCADCNFDFTYKNANPDDAAKRAAKAKSSWEEKRKTKKSQPYSPKTEFFPKKIQYKPEPSDRVIKNIIEIQPAPFARQSSTEANTARRNEESKAALLKRNEEERRLRDQKVVQSNRENKLILGAIALFIASLVFFGFARQNFDFARLEDKTYPNQKPTQSLQDCRICNSPNCVNCSQPKATFKPLETPPPREPEPEVDATSK